MPPSPSKTLSPAELAKLEHAFATDPASQAYRPLAEAYLAMGRYMEAMVVCKKGVKAHPDLADPRVLLARVYADQGKDKKALEELQSALTVSPTDKAALRLTGSLQLKTGEADTGKANLLKAYTSDPSDLDTQATMSQWKVEPPAPPAPPPQVVVAAPPVRVEQELSAQPDRPASGSTPPLLTPSVPASRPAPVPRNGAQTHAQPFAPARPPRPARPQMDEDEEPVSEVSQVAIPVRRKAKSGASKAMFLLLAVAVPLVTAGYFYLGRRNAENNRQIKKQLAESAEQLKHDNFESYKKACEAADQVLEIDPESTAAHGYLAYAYAIRWGEHGGGETAQKLALEHLESAKKGGEVSSHLYAAEALIKTYAGKGPEALSELEGRVKSFDAEGKQSSLLYLTLGLTQMNAGDLVRAKESLDVALKLAAGDPRVFAALGTLYRRLGQDSQAWNNFDFALRYERDHPESMVGKALLILDQDEPQYGTAAKILKKMIEAEPPPSPRQLATAHLARSLLVAKASADVVNYRPEFQKDLLEIPGVSTDKGKAAAEVAKAEETGFSLDRGNPELYLVKAKRLLYEQQFDAAVVEVKKAIDIDKTRAQFYVELAKALMSKPGGEKEAQQALGTAIKTMGESPKLVLMLGQAYQRQGKLDEALAQYNRAVSDPKAKNPDARLAMGQIYRERKDAAKAQEALEKAAQEFISQPTRVAESYAELGRVFEDKGDRVKADDAFLKALSADAEFAPSYFFYARFLGGDRKTAGRAREVAAEYLKKDPKGPFAADAQRLAQ